MVKELTVTFVSLLMFFLLVFAGELRGVFPGVQGVPQKKRVMGSSCPQMKNTAKKSGHGWEEDR